MTHILLFSDTHNYFDPRIKPHIATANEIWHAGDIGSVNFFDELMKEFPEKTFRVVNGNIDDSKTKITYPDEQLFFCEKVKVFITHIGGYPKHYAKGIKEKLKQIEPTLFVCGHSHILRVIYDKELSVLHMNPGAAGNHGFHQIKTFLKFDIDGSNITNLNIVEIAKRGD